MVDVGPLRPFEDADLQPDPRISTLRPGWLADDREWRDQLQAMTREDALWLDASWQLAGGAPPTDPGPDLSWITKTHLR